MSDYIITYRAWGAAADPTYKQHRVSAPDVVNAVYGCGIPLYEIVGVKLVGIPGEL